MVPVPALVFGQGGLCIAANAHACDLLGPGELLAADVATLFAGWSQTPALNHGGSPCIALHPDGRVFQCNAGPVENTGTCLTLIDVTGRAMEAAGTALDSLTGLLQRVGLKQRLVETIARAEREGTGAAVHFVDLDRFTAVNNGLGYAMGDALLAKVAERLRSTLRDGDFVGRLGGDEFAVVQTRADTPRAVEAVAARLVDLIGRTYVLQGQVLNVGVSLGVAMFPEDGSDAETLLRHADLALRRAQADGRGRFRFFEPSMDARIRARRHLEVDLRRALAMRQFHLNYQPLVALASNRIEGFEALLRWRHPERGLVSPAEFIPLAEDLALMTPIGEWVLRSACRQAAAWTSPVAVAVNISPNQFTDGKLVATVTSALAQSGLAASRLELEITEGTLLEDTDTVASTLHAIRALGVRVSMDDFGTGYSSLSYLRKFPFDKIKIDQSFVRGMGSDPESAAIVRTVVQLGASLGMATTAEGVETVEQLALIRAEGCDHVQGYLTGRPLPGDEADALLRRLC